MNNPFTDWLYNNFNRKRTLCDNNDAYDLYIYSVAVTSNISIYLLFDIYENENYDDWCMWTVSQ